MKSIRIAVVPAKPENELAVRYVREANTLAAESASTKPWLYGVDINSTVIFDLDEDRVLVNIDVHAARPRWRRTRGGSWPENARAGCLMFARSAVKHKSFNIPLRLDYDGSAGILHLRIGEPRAHTMAVRLSDRCVALAADGELLGFVYRGLS